MSHDDGEIQVFENCPGCKLDKLKLSNTSIPYKHFFFIFVICLCAAMPVLSLFPFIYFMVKDFDIAEREEDIGFYVGFIGSSFMLGRFFTSIFWGIVADRYGRKPVMLIGSVAVLVLNTVFGLSTKFWVAITLRFITGCLSGVLGTTKAYATEICRKEHQALGMTVVSTAWGFGLTIGSAIGGSLSQPAKNYPRIFSKDSLFGRFPYFLPSLVVAFIALIASIMCLLIPETLHFHKEEDREEEKLCNSSEATEAGYDQQQNLNELNRADHAPPKPLLRNWPFISSVLVYSVFQLHEMCYAEIFPLWAVSPKNFGGLSYTSFRVGVVLGISGLGMLFFQLLLYPLLERNLGPVKVARIGAGLTIALLVGYPFIAKLSGLALKLVLTCASTAENVLGVAINTGLFLLLNRAVSQRQRGAANGISLSAMSLAKAIGPSGAGAIYSWSVKRRDASFLPGDQMVFFILVAIEAIALIMTFKPFLALPTQDYT